MSGLMQGAVVSLHCTVPERFPLGVHGDAEIADAARSVLNAFMTWLDEHDTEVELAAELLHSQRPLVDDLTAARAQVREVVDVLQDRLEKHVGWLS